MDHGSEIGNLGVVPYWNALPLIEGLAGDAGVTLVRAVPSRLAELLAGSEIGAATLPIIDAAAREDYRVVPGIAIASRGPVRSVRLFHEKEIPEIRTVALDPASRTSVVLLRLLLERRFGVRPEYLAPDAAGPFPDGTLLIGDACLREEARGRRSLDLGEAWTDWTGLPFVYAAWVATGPLARPGTGLAGLLRDARDRGLAAIHRIAEEAARASGEDRARIESYLSRSMRYHLGEEEMEAIDRFRSQAREIGALRGESRIRMLREG